MSSFLDIENHDELLSYLRERGHISPTELPHMRNLHGGVSNRTVLIEQTDAPPNASGWGWVMKQALDKLRVEVYGEPQLSQGLQVRPDGKITLTLIGDVMAAGRTALELRDAQTLAPCERVDDRPARLLAAAFLGGVRLIDNIAVPQRPS